MERYMAKQYVAPQVEHMRDVVVHQILMGQIVGVVQSVINQTAVILCTFQPIIYRGYFVSNLVPKTQLWPLVRTHVLCVVQESISITVLSGKRFMEYNNQN